MSRRLRSLVVHLLLPIAVASLAAAPFAWNMKHRPARLFREVVLDPIPASVQHIKANHARWFSKHTYVFRFDVGLEDLALILRSGPFEEISCVKYDRGMLCYGETEDVTSSVWLYEVPRGEREPSWFNLEPWGRFRAYILEREVSDFYCVRLLLYHEGRGQAFFLEHEIRGLEPTGKEYRSKRRGTH